MNLPPLPLLVVAFAASTLSAQNINIDFGDTGHTTSGWNNISSSGDNVTPQIADLIDDNGFSTGITLDVTGFNPWVNNSGTQSPNVLIPSTATRDNLYGNTGDFNGVWANPTLTFSGLDTGSSYNFTVFASRMGVSDVRTANFEFSGATTESLVHDAANNDSQTGSISGLMPDGSGQIVVSLTMHETNTSSNGYFYLGAMTMETAISAVPEPSMFPLLLGLAAISVLVRRRR